MPPRDSPSFAALLKSLNVSGRTFELGATITEESLGQAKGSEQDETLGDPSRRSGAPPSRADLPILSLSLDSKSVSLGPGNLSNHDIVIVGLLGQGGMGRVLLGQQRSLSRDVAVKTVNDELLGTVHADALVEEGLITGFLEHPNIPPVHQLGVDSAGRPLLIMKRIAGVAWSDLIADPRHPAWDTIPTLPSDRLRAHLDILMQVCNGLSFAHSRSVVHRDVKPDNVMIGEFGEVYLCDWGIGVKLPVSREMKRGLVGTPSYIAPEMIDPESEIAPSMDIYLLGGTLHTILTGLPRHDGDDLPSALANAFRSDPYTYSSSIPGELAELANRATAHDPAERPSSVLSFRREIVGYLSHRTSNALSESARELLLRMTKEGEAGELREASRTAAECRYGFAQALREWPENPDALAGLEECLERAVRIEVQGENLSAAETALGEMKSASVELAAQVSALRERLDERAADAEKLKEIRHQGDLTVAARPRARLMVGLIAVAVLMSIGIRWLGLDPDSALAHVYFLTVIFSAASLGTLVWRKDLLTNQVNRRTAAVVLGSMGLEWIHAAEGYVAHANQADLHRSEMFIVIASTACASMMIAPRWFIATGVLLVGTIVSMLFPSMTSPAYVVGHMAILVVLAATNSRSTNT